MHPAILPGATCRCIDKIGSQQRMPLTQKQTKRRINVSGVSFIYVHIYVQVQIFVQIFCFSVSGYFFILFLYSIGLTP